MPEFRVNADDLVDAQAKTIGMNAQQLVRYEAAVNQLLRENRQLHERIAVLEEPKTGTPEMQTDEGLVQFLDQKEESG